MFILQKKMMRDIHEEILIRIFSINTVQVILKNLATNIQISGLNQPGMLSFSISIKFKLFEIQISDDNCFIIMDFQPFWLTLDTETADDDEND
ncbi:hypothetical protein BpHYR1_027929 [Brachionus plicatilis]|uniref:Uncharacterized protein n=1 Tax=Brachionus plicatilis TaxID=10195 RepID=A0A3M7PWV7_BRAPC|nr:hypothetical protein BpHYR1_027929 [Brachionus plicatilis]